VEPTEVGQAYPTVVVDVASGCELNRIRGRRKRSGLMSRLKRIGINFEKACRVRGNARCHF
jgi:hypothetical protein